MNANLIEALTIFTYKYDLDINQNLSSLRLSVENGYLDFDKIKEELFESITSESTDWQEIALMSRLIPDVSLYSNEEIKDYVKYLIYDYFFAEKALSESQRILLFVESENILANENNNWMYSKDILEKLRLIDELRDLDYFRLHDLKFKYLKFEWKYDLNKPYQIGYYRLKVQEQSPS